MYMYSVCLTAWLHFLPWWIYKYGVYTQRRRSWGGGGGSSRPPMKILGDMFAPPPPNNFVNLKS